MAELHPKQRRRQLLVVAVRDVMGDESPGDNMHISDHICGIVGAEDPEVSVVVTCKGRLRYLIQTLPFLLSQSHYISMEIIVVDFGCPQGTFQFLRQCNQANVTTMLVHDHTEFFNLSRARNCGANFARGKAIAFVDADIIPEQQWLARTVARVLAGRTELVQPFGSVRGEWDRNGTCVVSAELFHRVRGYDEDIRGWGPEDGDFYDRCKAVGKIGFFSPADLQSVRHDTSERVEHYPVRSIRESIRQIRQYLAQRRGAVNPSGYGLGEFSLHVGKGSNLRPRFSIASPARRRAPLRE